MALAGLVLAGAVAGCGFGPGADVGGVGLTVTRDYGTEPVVDEQVGDIHSSDTVMRALDRSADITTRYGGRFVASINGTEATQSGGRPQDWFFYVNGTESEVGAADVPLTAGDRIWWDYRDWGSAMRVPAVVGSFPAPFAGSTAVVDCGPGVASACKAVRGSVTDAGAKIVRSDGAVTVLVGTWPDIRTSRTAGAIAGGPQRSGVFARFVPIGDGGWSLEGLGVNGRTARSFGAEAGLVAATRRFSGPPTWIVTGGTPAAVSSAAGALNVAALRDRYAVAVSGGEATRVPVP